MMRRRISVPLRERLEDFYLRNPDEVLSLADMQVKFDASLANCKDSVFKLRKAGMLRAIGSPKRPVLYGTART